MPKILMQTIEETKKLEIKFGILDGKVVDKEAVEALAKLPSKETLLAMLLGLLKAPIRNLAYVLNEPTCSMARAIKAIAEK